MNKPAPINQTTLRILYYRNRPFILPTILFVLSLIIIVEAVFPQVQQWFTIHSAISSSLQKIDSLNKNIATLNKISEKDLDAKLEFLSEVLPENKDYVGILSAISSAAISSGTSLGDYNFNVGNLSSSETKNNTIQLKLSLTGGIVEARKFIVQLKKQTPLSSLADVEIGNDLITVVASFYFKPFPVVSYQKAQDIINLTPQEENLYTSLKSSLNTATPGAGLISL